MHLYFWSKNNKKLNYGFSRNNSNFTNKNSNFYLKYILMNLISKFKIFNSKDENFNKNCFKYEIKIIFAKKFINMKGNKKSKEIHISHLLINIPT